MIYGSGELSSKHIVKNGHPQWLPPQRLTEQPVLKIRNSLTGDIEEFTPSRNRQVRWYTCGPTVYDSAHVGHARSYVTFDIHRRILMDYFNYDVLYQINITDIDDKIILRARQNKLFEEFTKETENWSFEKLVGAVEAAANLQQEKLNIARNELESPLPSNANSRIKDERLEKLKQLELKKGNFETLLGRIDQVKHAKDNSRLLDVARDVLSNWLDKERGHTIQELKVFDVHARKFEREFLEDMEALGVRQPDIITRVTEYLPQIIDFIMRILERGLAYESNGSVYLDIEKFKESGHAYRKLDPSKIDTSKAELEESEGALGLIDNQDKRNQNDFALWKKSKPGEPKWSSPWGDGRPGWHIECSVVASDILGSNIDMHSGGEDLKFPHHDNELAQSEAHWESKQWVNYFTHAGHLHIKGLKMSKSLKNFITIREALKHHTARQLRLLFLLQDWDKPMNFSDQTVDDAKAKENTFRNFFNNVKALLREDWLTEEIGFRMNELDQELVEEFLTARETVHQSLLSNLDTKAAIQAMIRLVSKSNLYLAREGCRPAVLLLRSIAVYLTKMLGIFGVIPSTFDSIGFPASRKNASEDLETAVKPFMDTFRNFRDKIRAYALELRPDNAAKSKLLDLCDDVRNTDLVNIGVRLEDIPNKSSVWKLDDPGILKAEVKQKEEFKRLQERQKKLNRIQKLTKSLQSYEPLLTKPPKNFFDSDEYILDNEGIPARKTSEDKPLPKSRIKTLKKEKKAYEKLYEKLLQESNGNIKEYIENLKAEILSLKQQSESEQDTSK